MTIKMKRVLVPIALTVLIIALSCEKFNLEKLCDLVVENPGVNPTTVTRGYDITASCIITNKGNGKADFPVTQIKGLYYFLSSDMTYSTGDIPLGSTNINDIEAGASRNIAGVSLTIPGGTPPGNYYVLFYIDFENDLDELNEDNNVAHVAIQILN